MKPAGLLLLALVAVSLLAGIGLAERVSSTDYTLDYVIGNGGSASNLTGGSYTLMDVKSQPLIGLFSSSYGGSLSAGFLYLLNAGSIVFPPGGATYFVNNAIGKDTYTAAQAQYQMTPWKTIKKACNSTTAGDTIMVAAGKYTTGKGEAFPLKIPVGVSLIGAGPGLTTIEGTTVAYQFPGTPYSCYMLLTGFGSNTISNLTVNANSTLSSYRSAAVVFNGSKNIWLSNYRVVLNGEQNEAAIYITSASDVTLESGTVIANSAFGILLYKTCNNIRIKFNEVRGANPGSKYYGQSAGICGFALTGTVTIENCTVDGNHRGILLADVYVQNSWENCNKGIMYTYNNIVTNNTSGIAYWKNAATGSALYCGYSDAWGNTYDYGGGESKSTSPTSLGGNISADPQYVSLTAKDFHLQDTSPCIWTGTPAGTDMGAYDSALPYVPPVLTIPVNIKLYLQGFYSGDGVQTPTVISVEARADMATTAVAGSALVELDSSGQSAANVILPFGSYYLAIKHPKNDISIHLPIITKDPVEITNSGFTLDLTTGDKAYTLSGKIPAMFMADGKYFMRACDANGDKMVNEVDISHWFGAYSKQVYDPRADFNGDNEINEVDASLWWGVFNSLKEQHDAAHSYVND